MRYLGGKARIAKWVANHVLSLRGNKTRYVEPFVGSGAVFCKIAPHFEDATAADKHIDLILMWQALSVGWIPPDFVTKEEYHALKTQSPSPLRGFVGFGSSYRGKWFAGYSHVNFDSYWGRDSKPTLLAAKSSVIRDVKSFSGKSIACASYESHSIDDSCLVYCDPPYRNATGYKGAGKFDSDKFWKVASEWSRNGATVVVSETSAPAEWTVLASRERKAMLRRTNGAENEVRQERLFVFGNT